MNEFLGSSPTPSSKRSNDRCSDDDPPSSHPFISSHLQISQLTDAPLADENHAPMQVFTIAEEYPGNRFADESLRSTKGNASNVDSFNTVSNAPKPVNDREDGSELKAPQVPVDGHLTSDFDIYVDAPPVPSLNQPSSERNDNQPNDAISSFQSEASSKFSSEDDQVTAQLITEMERASSQQSAKPDETAKSASKKRKRTADSPSANKKTKRTPASSDLPVATEVPRTGETVADCVMIQVREADRLHPVPHQQIKREPSASPSIFTSTQVIEETPVAEKTPVVRPRNSEASQSSSQEQDMPMTAKKAIGRLRGSRNSQVKQEEAEKEQASALRKSTRVSERLCRSTTSSPHMSPAASQEATKGGQWLALGRTPRRGMFRWLRGSAESQDDGNLTPTACSANRGSAEGINKESRLQDSPADFHSEVQNTNENEDREPVAHQRDGEAQPETSEVVETEGDTTTAQGILQNLQSMLDKIKGIRFGPEEERAMIGILFESVKEVHEAGRRHTST